MQKAIEFYDNKVIDMLKPVCILPNVTNTCLKMSTTGKYHLFTKITKFSSQTIVKKKLEDSRQFSNERLLLTQFLFASPQNFAIRLLKKKPANFTFTQ